MEAALTFRAHDIACLIQIFLPLTNSPTVQVNENSAVHNSGQRKIRHPVNKDHSSPFFLQALTNCRYCDLRFVRARIGRQLISSVSKMLRFTRAFRRKHRRRHPAPLDS